MNITLTKSDCEYNIWPEKYNFNTTSGPFARFSKKKKEILVNLLAVVFDMSQKFPVYPSSYMNRITISTRKTIL